MTYISNNQGLIDSNNSLNTNLGSGDIFIGTPTNVVNYSSLIVYLYTDQQSADDGLVIEFSDSATGTFTTNVSFTITQVGKNTFPVLLSSSYYRITYTNGSTPTTNFVLQSILKTTSITNVINGLSNVNDLIPVNISGTGNMSVQIQDPLTAFGEVSVANMTPIVQLTFQYKLLNQTSTGTTTGSGSYTTTNGCLVLSTTSSIGTAYLRSKTPVIYKAGQGICARLTAIYTTGLSNSLQYAGVGDPTENGFFFGYENTTFGIIYINNTIKTFIPQTSWNVDLMNGQRGIHNPSGMLLDQTKGNVYQIKYQYLGFGAITFFIENYYTGKFQLVHVIKYANQNTNTNLRNPTFPVSWYVSNTGSNVITLKAGTGSLFVEGIRQYLGCKFGLENALTSKNYNANTDYVLMALRIKSTFGGITTLGQDVFRNVSFSSRSASKLVNIFNVQFILDATPSTTLTWSDVNTSNSITEYYKGSGDPPSITTTGGTFIYNFTVSCDGDMYSNITDLNINFDVGSVLYICISVPIAISNTDVVLTCGLNWVEDL